jgi:hypothetical protein
LRPNSHQNGPEILGVMQVAKRLFFQNFDICIDELDFTSSLTIASFE